MRAVTSFEAIVLSQIEVKRRLGERLNNSIRAGIIILGIVAVSIMILLLTLSTQINRISGIVYSMNVNFSAVASHMTHIDHSMASMQQRVVLLEDISRQTEVMNHEMQAITGDLSVMRNTIGGIQHHFETVRGNIDHISVSINRMNVDVQRMGADMHRMGQPARAINKMFPFQ